MAEYIELDKIYISNLCNGNISVQADISEITDAVDNNDASQSSVEFHISDSDEEGIEVEGGDTKEYIVEYASEIGDDTTLKMRYIPAFYSGGSVRIDAILMETDDPDSKIDITFDVLMYIDDEVVPGWYPYNLKLTGSGDSEKMCDVLDGIITSPNANVLNESIGENTNLTTQFTIGSWKGMRPIINQWPPFMDGVHIGCLPDVYFKVKCKNNLEDAVRFSSITVSFSFNYDTNATLCNLGNPKSSDFAQLYPGPRNLPSGENNTNLWAIVDGYSGGSVAVSQEIIKVFGYVYHSGNDGDTESFEVVPLLPVAETGGTNFPPVVYKSNTEILSTYDNTRLNKKGTRGGEVAWVITPAVICQDVHFKEIEVECLKPVSDLPEEEEDGESVEDTRDRVPCHPSDEDAEFWIKLKLRDDIPEYGEGEYSDYLSRGDFDSVIDIVKFFNVDVGYTSYDYENDKSTLVVNRSDIDKTFYDTLGGNLSSYVVLKSSRGDVEPFVMIKINSWTTFIPIYNNNLIEFRESLTQCSDGVRSRDLWVFGEKGDPNALSNVIKVGDMSEKRYRVKLKVVYDRYKNMHVHRYKTDEEERE